MTTFSLHILSKINISYYSVLLLTLYTVLGPWFVGEIIDGKLGCCFSFGIFVDGHFLQGGLTFINGIIQLVFFNIPLMAYVCWSLLHRCFGHSFRSHLHQGKYWKIIPVYLLMLLLYIWQVYSCYFLHVTYGSLAFTFSPLRTWLTLLTPVLIYRVWTLNSTELGIFMVQLKSHLSSWSPWLTASSLEEVQPPHLWLRSLPCGRWESQYQWVSFRKQSLLGHLNVGNVYYWFLLCGLQKSLTIDSSSGGKEP